MAGLDRPSDRAGESRVVPTGAGLRARRLEASVLLRVVEATVNADPTQPPLRVLAVECGTDSRVASRQRVSDALDAIVARRDAALSDQPTPLTPPRKEP